MLPHFILHTTEGFFFAVRLLYKVMLLLSVAVWMGRFEIILLSCRSCMTCSYAGLICCMNPPDHQHLAHEHYIVRCTRKCVIPSLYPTKSTSLAYPPRYSDHSFLPSVSFSPISCFLFPRKIIFGSCKIFMPQSESWNHESYI